MKPIEGIDLVALYQDSVKYSLQKREAHIKAVIGKHMAVIANLESEIAKHKSEIESQEKKLAQEYAFMEKIKMGDWEILNTSEIIKEDDSKDEKPKEEKK